jgi:hypothetical protein
MPFFLKSFKSNLTSHAYAGNLPVPELRFSITASIVPFDPATHEIDAVIISYYRDRDRIYVARARNGFVPASRHTVFQRLRDMRIEGCPSEPSPAPVDYWMREGDDGEKDERACLG